MTRLEVGKPIPDAPELPEGCFYNFLKGEHWLSLNFPNPTREEVLAITKGRFELRAIGNDLAMFVIFRFGAEGTGLPWSEARFEWSRVPPEERMLPDDASNFWRIVLLDTATQKVAGLRGITTDPEFQKAVNDGIRLQANRLFPPKEADVERYVERMNRYSPEELAHLAGTNYSFRTLDDPSLVSFSHAMQSFKTGKTRLS